MTAEVKQDPEEEHIEIGEPKPEEAHTPQQEIMATYVRKPELFSGEEPEQFADWLIRFEVIATANGWDNARQLAVLPSYLTQYAFQVYEELPGASKEDLKLMKDGLKAKLSAGDRQMVWRLQFRATKRNPGESLDAYAFRLRKLVCRAYPTLTPADQDLINKEQFIIGLGSGMQFNLLKLKDDASMADVIDTAKRFEAATEIVHGANAVHTVEAVTKQRSEFTGTTEACWSGYDPEDYNKKGHTSDWCRLGHGHSGTSTYNFE